MINKAKPGDAVRINNTVYVKQANGTWKSPFETCLESVFANRAAGKNVDYLFLEKPEPKKVENVVRHEPISLEIKPKEIKNVQERKKTNKQHQA